MKYFFLLTILLSLFNYTQLSERLIVEVKGESISESLNDSLDFDILEPTLINLNSLPVIFFSLKDTDDHYRSIILINYHSDLLEKSLRGPPTFILS